VSEQKAREFRFDLLQYCSHLMVEGFNCETIDATASRKPESLKIDQIYEEAV